MNPLNEKKQKLIQEFEQIPNWEDRYKKIIDMGKSLPSLPESLKNDQSLVRGCQSQVWIVTELDTQGNLIFRGDSDAIIVKGLVALITQLYSGAKPEDVLKFQPDFMKSLGFDTHLSPSRTNGLFAMMKRIVTDAFHFSTNKR